MTKHYINISENKIPEHWKNLKINKLSLFTFEKGENLICEEYPLKYIYYILSGKVKITRNSPDGKLLTIATDSAGAFLGELEVLLENKSSSTAKALTKVSCLAVDSDDYKNLLLQNPQELWKLAQLVAIRSQIGIDNTTTNILSRLEERLSVYILNHSEKNYFEENLTLLSEKLGSSYRHLQRTLKKFCDDNLLKKSGNGYQILDKTALEKSGYKYVK